MTDTFERVASTLKLCQAVEKVSEPSTDAKSGSTIIEVTIKVPMVISWWAAGSSPNGVFKFETVRLEFFSDFPLVPPEVSLRPDFGRHMAHVQPDVTYDNRPIPCLYEGVYAEIFLHSVTLEQSITELIQQLVSWLEKAATGHLIDPSQGWEPIRRDMYRDYVVVDERAIRGRVRREAGFDYLRFVHMPLADISEKPFVAGEVRDETLVINPEQFNKVMTYKDFGNGLVQRSSIAILVWPGKLPSGKPFVCDQYKPEDIRNISELKDRADMYGCLEQLELAFKLLGKSISAHPIDLHINLCVILCARRPFNLIGTNTDIELCPYTFTFECGVLLPQGDATPVMPMAPRDAISKALFQRMAGKQAGEVKNWVAIGAGSLGSKVILHLARGGSAPTGIVDKKKMLPYNYARHALVPSSGVLRLEYHDGKARILSDLIAKLDADSKAYEEDVISLLAGKPHDLPWSKKTWCLLNTTASVVVREALNKSDNKICPARIVEAATYASGNVGFISIEGTERNPRTLDLLAEFYAVCAADESLSKIVFSDKGIDYLRIGDGCGTLTMPLSDEDLSIFAAGVAKIISEKQKIDLPANGEIIVGTRSPDGYGMSYKTFKVLPVKHAQLTTPSSWSIIIHDRAAVKIQTDVDTHSGVETGGVIIGRISEVNKTINIVDIIPAPPDSTRSASEFVLGTAGLDKTLEESARKSGGNIYCLGTWHNHLIKSRPSARDKKTAMTLSGARITPSVMLIHMPDGSYDALVTEHSRS